MGFWYDFSFERKFSYMNDPPGSENSAIIFEKASAGSSLGSASADPKGFAMGRAFASANREMPGTGNGTGVDAFGPSSRHNVRPAPIPNTKAATIEALCFMVVPKHTP